MTSTTDDILVRALDVTVRRGEDDGLLLETLIGRYMLNRDAREIWQEIDGRRSVAQVAESVAAAKGVPVGAVREPVGEICARLLGLRLLERV